MIIQERTESRKDYLLRVTLELLKSPMVEYIQVDYDSARCDGYCLAEDIKAALENKN